MEDHAASCTVWEWVAGDRTYNATKACTCGVRKRAAERRAEELASFHPLVPLRMTDDEFLRTLRIDPEDTCEG